MKKTISFELSKRLDELWLLRDIETEYEYLLILKHENSPIEPSLYETTKKQYVCTTADVKYFKGWFKTLTTDESNKIIKFNTLPEYVRNHIITLYIQWFNNWKTLLEAKEKMITYLLDNNLITK